VLPRCASCSAFAARSVADVVIVAGFIAIVFVVQIFITVLVCR
jgi:hypothetical protein